MAFDETKAKIVRAGTELKAGQAVATAEDGNAYPAAELARVKYWPLGLLGPFHYEFQGHTRLAEPEVPGAITYQTTPVGPVTRVPARRIIRIYYYLVYKWYLKLRRRKAEEHTEPNKWALVQKAREGGSNGP